MYTPPAFREDDPAALRALMAEARLATLVTATAEGLIATPLPLLFDPTDGPGGTLWGHVARANPQWRSAPLADALVVFMGPDAYVTPSWYATKAETGKVVPTWNYVAVHAYGPVAFFDDEDGLRRVVARLTDHHEGDRADPWSVDDAPADYLRSQLKGIVGVRVTVTRLEGKRKMSQNRPLADRIGVAAGLGGSDRETDRAVAAMIPTRP